MKERDNTKSTIIKHEIKSFNFEFMLNTKLEQYYEKLIDDEIIFSKKPTNEKIYIDCRVISEDIVNIVASKLFKDSSFRKRTFNENLEKIRGTIPDEINKNFYDIRINGNHYAHSNSLPYSVTVEEIFRAVHSCLLWYFKCMGIGIDEKYDVDFVIPNHKITGENEKRYFKLIEQQKKECGELKEKLEETEKKLSDREEEIEKLKNGKE